MLHGRPYGLVSLVGAGPGDPELLTVRAAQRLAVADVVLHDALVDPRILALATRARCMDVGKRAGGRHHDQRALERLLIRLSQRGHRVVRLKGGDPFVFGRGGEEALALAAAGIPWEVVPGLTSAVAVPALAGIPVTHRSVASSFLVVSGHDPDTAVPIVRGLEPNRTTIVVLMPKASRLALAQALLASGWKSGTPTAAIQNGARADQRIWRGALETLAQAPDSEIFPGGRSGPDGSEGAPGLLVIGETVNLADTLAAAGIEAAACVEPQPARAARQG
jgi:uroporphyrin-III C-methyltransferase/precorrin-2 dehydrogenase/sirohydrochlorin ferrochelatase